MPPNKLELVNETYLKDKDRKLTRVDALYKNDTSFGLGFTIAGSAVDQFHELMDNYEKAWRETNDDGRANIVRSYFEQLNTGGLRSSDDLSYGEKVLLILNIAFLEKEGYIKSDEYNGCRYTYEVNPDQLDDFLDGLV